VDGQSEDVFGDVVEREFVAHRSGTRQPSVEVENQARHDRNKRAIAVGAETLTEGIAK
jgi:hypothetical protein